MATITENAATVSSSPRRGLARVARTIGRLIPRRTWTIALSSLVVLVGGLGGGFYAYAVHEWHAAQRAIAETEGKDARQHLKICLLLWPRSADVHRLAARAARMDSPPDFEAANAELNLCLKLEHGATAPTQVERLLMRVQSGEEEKVAPLLREYVDSGYPEATLILETLARAYMHELRLNEAYLYLGRWIQIAPDDAKPYNWRGWVEERLEDPKDAMEDYLRALERDPTLWKVKLRVAEMLLDDHKPPEAIKHLEPLIREHPDEPRIQARLGHCYYLQGQPAQARPLLEAALKQLPDDMPTLLTLAKLDLQDNQYARAEQLLLHLRDLDPFDTEGLYTLHTALQLQGRHKEAEMVLADYTKKKDMVLRANKMVKDEATHPSHNPDVYADMGAALIEVLHDKIGQYWLDQALLLDPSHKRAHQIYADFWESKGEKEKAQAHRRWLMGTKPSVP